MANETVEEAAYRLYRKGKAGMDNDFEGELAFLHGAQWQREELGYGIKETQVKEKEFTIYDGEHDELTITLVGNLIWIDTSTTCLYFYDKEKFKQLAHFILNNIDL